MFTRVGINCLRIYSSFIGLCLLLGNMVLTLPLFLANFKHNIYRYLKEVYQCGPKSLPTVFIISFLLGTVIVALSASQFKLFGAEIYAANLIGIAVARELAPLITAICLLFLATARFTDEIASTENLDKDFYAMCLVRIFAMASASPILSLFAFYAALLGGSLTAKYQFDIHWLQFWGQVFTAVPITDVILGFLKAIIFGAEIAVVGCFYGMICNNNKKPLGKSIILSISMGILLVVFTDSMIELLLYLFS